MHLLFFLILATDDYIEIGVIVYQLDGELSLFPSTFFRLYEEKIIFSNKSETVCKDAREIHLNFLISDIRKCFHKKYEITKVKGGRSFLGEHGGISYILIKQKNQYYMVFADSNPKGKMKKKWKVIENFFTKNTSQQKTCDDAKPTTKPSQLLKKFSWK